MVVLISSATLKSVKLILNSSAILITNVFFYFRAKLHIRDLCPSETASMCSDEEQVVLSDAVMTQATKLGLNDKIASHLYFV